MSKVCNWMLCSALSLALAACGSGPVMAPPPTGVAAVMVHAQPWRASLHTTATVMALQGAVLKSEVAGRVTQVGFQAGTNVAQGSVLFAINPAYVAAQLKVAQAQADLDLENYRRALKLYSEHVISKADYDRAKSAAKANQANVDAAQAALDQAVVRAPFSGQVGLNLVQLGDYVSVGQALVSLQQIDRLRIDFSVPEQYSDQLHLGDAVTVSARDGEHAAYAGSISAIDNSINQDTRLLAVRAELANPQKSLLPGAFVAVTAFYGPQASVITVPQDAVVSAGMGDSVYRIVADKAVMTKITLGPRFADQVIVLSGLKAGDRVITSGQLKLQDGATVAVNNEAPHG